MGIKDTSVLTLREAVEETGLNKEILNLVGEYQFTDGTSNKFYCFYIVMHNGNARYMTSWGRIGSRAGGSKEHESFYAVSKVVLEKISKGYDKVDNANQLVVDTIDGGEDNDQFLLPDSVLGKKDIYRITRRESAKNTKSKSRLEKVEKSSSTPSVSEFLENLRKI
jgi:predicted DNA-binding WGR domain protein